LVLGSERNLASRTSVASLLLQIHQEALDALEASDNFTEVGTALIGLHELNGY
jgi:hypothetical protein